MLFTVLEQAGEVTTSEEREFKEGRTGERGGSCTHLLDYERVMDWSRTAHSAKEGADVIGEEW